MFSDPSFNEYTKLLFQSMGLAEHKVNNYSIWSVGMLNELIFTCSTFINPIVPVESLILYELIISSSPGDIEGHKGTDGNYYLLDFARVLPCEAPAPGSPEVFYNVLRREFLDHYATIKSLNPDCFTNWNSGEPNKAQHERDIIDATKY